MVEATALLRFNPFTWFACRPCWPYTRNPPQAAVLENVDRGMVGLLITSYTVSGTGISYLPDATVLSSTRSSRKTCNLAAAVHQTLHAYMLIHLQPTCASLVPLMVLLMCYSCGSYQRICLYLLVKDRLRLLHQASSRPSAHCTFHMLIESIKLSTTSLACCRCAYISAATMHSAPEREGCLVFRILQHSTHSVHGAGLPLRQSCNCLIHLYTSLPSKLPNVAVLHVYYVTCALWGCTTISNACVCRQAMGHRQQGCSAIWTSNV